MTGPRRRKAAITLTAAEAASLAALLTTIDEFLRSSPDVTAGLPETEVALLIWQDFELPGEHSCNEHPPSGLTKGQYNAFTILGMAHADRSADPRHLNAAVSVTACPAPMPGRVGEIRSSHRSVPSLAGSHCI